MLGNSRFCYLLGKKILFKELLCVFWHQNHKTEQSLNT